MRGNTGSPPSRSPGLGLDSILQGELLLRNDGSMSSRSYLDHLNPEKLQKAREDLLVALCSSYPDLVLEMHITAVPDLFYRAQSHILITLFLRTSGPSPEKVKERLAAAYLSLVPVLHSYLPEAEFAPLTGEEELQERLSPFEPGHCLSVTRRKEKITLSAPMKRGAIGFGASHDKGADHDHTGPARHVFPWLPSHKEL